MFLSLFSQECKKISKSILYYAFIIIMVLFYISQYASHTSDEMSLMIREPRESDASYGYRYAELPDQVMPKLAGILYRECSENSYASYPFGFIKYVKLNENEQAKAAEIFHEITGYTLKEYNDYLVNEYKENQEFTPITTPISETMTYERFKELMAQMEEMVGSGSSYSDFQRYGREELTYEDAMEEHKNLIEEDKVTGEFARVFSDYMGIVLGVFPAFLVVSFVLQDKKAKMQELIFSREASPLVIVGARMLALILMMLLPLIILGILSTLQIFFVARSMNYSVDLFAFVKYIFVWLLPTLLFTVSLSYLITEVTENTIAILIQVAVWLYNISGTKLYGDYGLSLMIRHNVYGAYDIYREGFDQIVNNRIFYCVLSIILFFISVFIYSQKRKGKVYAKGKVIKVSRNISDKSVA